MATKQKAAKPKGKLGKVDPDLKEALPTPPGETVSPPSQDAGVQSDVAESKANATIESKAVVKEGFGEDAVDVLEDRLWVRQFSLDAHGRDWKGLATGFLDKMNAAHPNRKFRPVDPARIEGVLVVYVVEDIDKESNEMKGMKKVNKFFKDERKEVDDFCAQLSVKDNYKKYAVLR